MENVIATGMKPAVSTQKSHFFYLVIFSFDFEKKMSMFKVCKICNRGKIEYGKDFCEACRSFYTRNRKRSPLTCKNDQQNFKCLKLDHQETLETSVSTMKNGQTRRFLCPACRLAKCIWIKSSNESHPQRTTTKEQFQKSISPSTNSGIQNEQYLQMLIKASQDFSNNLDKLPFRSGEICFANNKEVWQQYIATFEQQVKYMKIYSSFFSFYRNLNVKDRVSHILSIKQRLVVGENLTNPNDLYIACLSTENVLKAATVMIPLLTMREQGIITKQHIDSLKWSMADFAFLLGFLCIDGKNYKLISSNSPFIFVVLFHQFRVNLYQTKEPSYFNGNV